MSQKSTDSQWRRGHRASFQAVDVTWRPTNISILCSSLAHNNQGILDMPESIAQDYASMCKDAQKTTTRAHKGCRSASGCVTEIYSDALLRLSKDAFLSKARDD